VNIPTLGDVATFIVVAYVGGYLLVYSHRARQLEKERPGLRDPNWSLKKIAASLKLDKLTNIFSKQEERIATRQNMLLPVESGDADDSQ
jgi:hypothetical protein